MPEASKPLVSAGCLNHVLQLTINDEIFTQKSVTDVIKKSRELVSHANHSLIFYKELNDQQKEFMKKKESECRNLIQDVETRYSSCRIMSPKLIII